MKKKILIFAGVGILLFAAVIAIFSMRDLQEEEKLKKEVSVLSELDLLTDSVDMTIKTKREYGIVEKTIKEYMTEYSNLLKDTMKMIEDEMYTNVLSLDNLEKNGPAFVEEKKLVKEIQEKTNTKLGQALDMSTERALMKRIEEKKLDSYYNDLYRDLTFGDTMQKDLEEIRTSIAETKSTINKECDITLQILDLLSEHPDVWYIEDEDIYITDNAVLRQYNSLIQKLS